MQKIKFRMAGDDLQPRRTRMEIPGWAGEPEKRSDGSHEYAWHCVPFTEAAKYGVEIFYPYQNELRASTRNGRLILEGDFGPPPAEGRSWPPFRNFGDSFYTYQLLLDLKPEPGFGDTSELLYGHDRHGADRCSRAYSRMVADALLHGLQIAGGRPDPYLPAGNAVGAVYNGSCGKRVRARTDGL